LYKDHFSTIKRLKIPDKKAGLAMLGRHKRIKT
jgi:hypothetical protein